MKTKLLTFLRIICALKKWLAITDWLGQVYSHLSYLPEAVHGNKAPAIEIWEQSTVLTVIPLQTFSQATGIQTPGKTWSKEWGTARRKDNISQLWRSVSGGEKRGRKDLRAGQACIRKGTRLGERWLDRRVSPQNIHLILRPFGRKVQDLCRRPLLVQQLCEQNLSLSSKGLLSLYP